MIDSVQRSNQVAPSQPPPQMGAAPVSAAHRDTISGQPQAKQKGYIELAVLALRDLSFWIFEKIYSMFSCNRSQNQPPVIDDREPPILRPEPGQERLPEIDPEELLRELSQMQPNEILRYFAENVPTPLEQNGIYTQIGRQASSWERCTWRSYREIGESKVLDNPRLLLPFLGSLNHSL